MKITKPDRKKHSYTQHIDAPPESVFPLLCPVREIDWAPGWLPELVISESGVCEQECIFMTPPEVPSEGEDAVWIVTKYDAAAWELEMYKVVPGHTVSKLEITLAPAQENTTTAQISYELTAIGAAGEAFMTEFTASWYEAFMLEWEQAMNHYLATGEMIAS